jgi:hypothetical protein
MEAPLYPYIAGLLLKVSRDSILGPRLISWLSLVALVAALFALLGRADRDRRDAWADRAALLIALAATTMIAVDFRTTQPEALCAGLSTLSALFMARYGESDKRQDAIAGVALAGLAVLAKPLALAVLPALVLFAAMPSGRSDERTKQRLERGAIVLAGLFLVILPYYAWDHWAQHLRAFEMNGNNIISIEHDPKAMLASLKNPGYEREAVLHFLPHYAGSWWLVPALVAGIYRALADARLRRIGIPFAVWLAGFTFELLCFGDRLHSNAYYFVLAPTPILFFSAVGLGALVRALEASDARPSLLTFRTALVAFMITAGYFTAASTNWSSIQPADLGLEHNRTTWTTDLSLVRIGLGFILALSLGHIVRPKRIPSWIGVPLVIAVIATGRFAFADTDQYLAFHAGRGRGSFNQELRQLRAAVAAHSTPKDRIVLSPGEMVYFAYALRDGIPVNEVPPAHLEQARAQGVRLYLQIGTAAETAAQPKLPGELLASGPWWRLQCVAADGCPPIAR